MSSLRSSGRPGFPESSPERLPIASAGQRATDDDAHCGIDAKALGVVTFPLPPMESWTVAFSVTTA
jgi:hypothetical protein